MENKENLKKAIIQFIKFGTVGAINTVITNAIILLICSCKCNK